jgi:hypothetical protein
MLANKYFNFALIKLTVSVVYWLEFLATDPEDPGLIPDATIFSEKCHLSGKVAAPGLENQD